MWKVYDFMRSNSDVYGPLPKKRWIRDIPHKPHKLSYRFHYSQRGSESADAFNERHAIEYARWLARRDGVFIPADANARVQWSGFYSATKKRAVKTWNRVVERATYCRRIEAVNFGRTWREEHYAIRKDGRRGAWTHTTDEQEVVARIEIPHWDWEPAEPVEVLDLEMAA